MPQGFSNIELMLDRVTRTEALVGVCGTCMDARAIEEGELIAGTHRSSMDELTAWTQWAELTAWTQWAEKVLVF